jgi:single-strand DNA-binding protein
MFSTSTYLSFLLGWNLFISSLDFCDGFVSSFCLKSIYPKAKTTAISFNEAPDGNFFDEISDNTYSTDVAMTPSEALYELGEDAFDEIVPKINSVTLVGRVGQDPQPRYFEDGKCVLRMSLAVKRKYHPLEYSFRGIRSGEEETDWFSLELWGRDAEYAGKFVTKGARIGVTGTLEVDSWRDKLTGEEKSSPKIVVRHLDILETKAEAELRQGRGRGSSGGYYQGSGSNSGSGNSSNQNYYGYSDRTGEDFGDGPDSAVSGGGGFFDN